MKKYKFALDDGSEAEEFVKYSDVQQVDRTIEVIIETANCEILDLKQQLSDHQEVMHELRLHNIKLIVDNGGLSSILNNVQASMFGGILAKIDEALKKYSEKIVKNDLGQISEILERQHNYVYGINIAREIVEGEMKREYSPFDQKDKMLF